METNFSNDLHIYSFNESREKPLHVYNLAITLCVCVCVCVRERERDRESVCVCVWERERERERERNAVYHTEKRIHAEGIRKQATEKNNC
jgi:hypothetical protein